MFIRIDDRLILPLKDIGGFSVKKISGLNVPDQHVLCMLIDDDNVEIFRSENKEQTNVVFEQLTDLLPVVKLNTAKIKTKKRVKRKPCKK
jgi:hypothetical protein